MDDAGRAGNPADTVILLLEHKCLPTRNGEQSAIGLIC